MHRKRTMILETAEYSDALLNFAFFVTLAIFTLPSIVSTVLVLRNWRRRDQALGTPQPRPAAEVVHFPRLERRRKAA